MAAQLSSGGPQSERDRMWRGIGNTNMAQREDILAKDKSIYEGEIARMKEENRTLKDQFQRALKELRGYQLKYPSPFVPDYTQEDEEHDLISPWALKPDIMTPLLEAYDTKIRELEDTIKQQTFKIENFKDKMQSLAAENDELRRFQLNALKDSFQVDGTGNKSSPLHTELLAEMHEKVQILIDENALLTDQKLVLGGELDKQQSALEALRHELLSSRSQQAEQDRSIAKLSMNCQRAEQDREEAARQALACSEALSRAEQDLQLLQEKLLLTANKNKDLAAESDQLRQQVQGQARAGEMSQSSAFQRVQQAEARVKELQQLVHVKQAEAEQLAEALRKIRGEYKSTRQDAEGMLQVMNGLEKQLAEYAQREESAHKMMLESRMKIEEALMVKEQCAVREEQARREVERLMLERKALALSRQEDITQAMDQVRSAMLEKVVALEEDLQAMTVKHAALIAEAERAQRESKSLKEQHDKLHALHATQAQKTDSELKRLQERLREATAQREEERITRMDLQGVNQELRAMVDKYRNMMDGHKQEVFQLDRSHDQELSSFKHVVKDLQQALADKTRLADARQSEAEELVQQQQRQLDELDNKYSHELSSLRHRLAEADRMLADYDRQLAAQQQSHQLHSEQLQEKHRGYTASLESRAQSEAEKARLLTLRARQLDLQVRELSQDKEQLHSLLHEVRDAMQSTEQETLKSQLAVAELGRQLEASHARSEQHLFYRNSHGHGSHSVSSSMMINSPPRTSSNNKFNYSSNSNRSNYLDDNNNDYLYTTTLEEKQDSVFK